jgi:hypothetical protein
MEDASPRSELGEILTSEMGDILDIVSHNHILTMIRVWLPWSDAGERVLMRPVPRAGPTAWH